ncbi:3-deoxy-manno-octulosonate cytidylyltransferase [Synergistales bacterium]|nr:3-deoxy-manno-octulosonate cytidylyltransferase [Synergistales bacterium]
MENMSGVITLIPARMNSSRLPGKALLDIGGKSLIQRVYENVLSAIDCDVVIASPDEGIIRACDGFGARAVLTARGLPSGTDAIADALRKIDPNGRLYDRVVNFQGDSVNVNPRVTWPLIDMVGRTGCDMATCAALFDSECDVTDPNNVKVVMGLKPDQTEGRALYFTRAAAPYIRDPERRDINRDFYHHIGIYVFKTESLHRFVSLPEGVLEARERLEQLRMIENGMTIHAKLVARLKITDGAPADVNTPEEYEMTKKSLIHIPRASRRGG